MRKSLLVIIALLGCQEPHRLLDWPETIVARYQRNTQYELEYEARPTRVYLCDAPPPGARCVFTTPQRWRLAILLRMHIRAVEMSLGMLTRDPHIRLALVADPARLDRVLDRLFPPEPSTNLEAARAQLCRQWAAVGTDAFLGPIGPRLPTELLLDAATHLDDAELVAFTQWWNPRSHPIETIDPTEPMPLSERRSRFRARCWRGR